MALNYSVFNGLLPILFFFLAVISHYLTFVGSTQDLGKPRRFGSAVYMRRATDGRTLFLMRSFSTPGLQRESAPHACSEPKDTAVGQLQGRYQEKAGAPGWSVTVCTRHELNRWCCYPEHSSTF